MFSLLALVAALFANPPEPAPVAVPAPCQHPPVPIAESGGAMVDGDRYPYSLLHVSVDASGRVTGVTVAAGSTNADADKNAVQAVRRWRFVPAQTACKAVDGTLDIAVGLHDPDNPYQHESPFADPCNHDATVIVQRLMESPGPQYLPKNHAIEAQVAVTVGPDGRLSNIHIYQSSGIDVVDGEAINAMRESWYAPKVVACTPVPENIIFHASFTE